MKNEECKKVVEDMTTPRVSEAQANSEGMKLICQGASKGRL